MRRDEKDGSVMREGLRGFKRIRTNFTQLYIFKPEYDRQNITRQINLSCKVKILNTTRLFLAGNDINLIYRYIYYIY